MKTEQDTHIRIEGLSYAYPESAHKALESINLGIASGEVLFICGDSGCGKTTLGKCITGAVPGFYGGEISGTVRIGGTEISELPHRVRAAEITMVFQDPERQLMMNRVHREIAFGLENIGVKPSRIKRRVWESMQFCNILELWDREISTLSGGQKQKVAIASAIAYMPKCIIFDEPTSQLDPLAAEEIITLIGKINKELGITAIIIEQRLDKCFEISNRILHLENGRVDFFGSREEFYKQAGEHNLPVHLRLARHAGLQAMPASMKETRRLLQERGGDASGSLPAPVPREGAGELLRFKGMSTGYGGRMVIRNLDCTVKEGDFIGVFGPNGAGKSTLLKAAAGLLKYSGSLKVQGVEVSKCRSRDIGGVLGYVSQNPNDYLSKDTVYEELKFTLDNYGSTDLGVIDEVLEQLQIKDIRDKNPRDLSGGERQRVAIASVLVNRQRILLLDEPTRGLDARLKNQLGRLLAGLNQEGIAIILVTHDLEFATEFCERYMLLFDGEIISSGTRDEVLADGIFYTTAANKILRDSAPGIYTVNQAKEWLDGYGG